MKSIYWKGGALSKAFGVRVEVEFLPIYESQPLFGEVDSILRRLGYEVFDILPCYWKRGDNTIERGRRGQLVWADALYFRDFSSFLPSLDRYDVGSKKTKILKILVLLLAYGYLDYAYWIIRKDEIKELFSDAELNFVSELISSSRWGKVGGILLNELRQFRGMGFLSRLLFRLGTEIAPCRKDRGGKVFREPRGLGNI